MEPNGMITIFNIAAAVTAGLVVLKLEKVVGSKWKRQ